jgi:hypothetical protein
VAVVLAAALGGCGTPAKTYPIAPAAAWAELMGTTIPGMAFGETAHGMPASGTPDHLRLVATLTPVAGGNPSPKFAILACLPKWDSTKNKSLFAAFL